MAIGGLVVLATGAHWIDPVLSFFVSAIILVGIVPLVREAVDVLLESAPSHATIPAVRERMLALAGVEGVHDLHVWTIGSGEHVLSAHVLLGDARISEASAILRQIETAFARCLLFVTSRYSSSAKVALRRKQSFARNARKASSEVPIHAGSLN